MGRSFSARTMQCHTVMES